MVASAFIIEGTVAVHKFSPIELRKTNATHSLISINEFQMNTL